MCPTQKVVLRCHAGGFEAQSLPRSTTRQESALPDWIPALIRIDYVRYRGEAQATEAQVSGYLGSDSLPVIVTLALP